MLLLLFSFNKKIGKKIILNNASQKSVLTGVDKKKRYFKILDHNNVTYISREANFLDTLLLATLFKDFFKIAKFAKLKCRENFM